MIALESQSAEAYYLRGTARLQSYGDSGLTVQRRAAINDFTMAIAFDENFEEAYYFRGVAHMDANSYTEALADYQSAITINPGYQPALEAISDLQESTQDFVSSFTSSSSSSYNSSSSSSYSSSSSRYSSRNSSSGGFPPFLVIILSIIGFFVRQAMRSKR